jgi:hypothetical protein
VVLSGDPLNIEFRFEPLVQRIEQRLGLRLAYGTAFVSRFAASRVFDSIQRADPLQRFPRA